MKFKKGEKVTVNTYRDMPINWNNNMFRLMGKIVTIESVRGFDREWPYTIEEAPNWVWREQDFKSLLTDVNDPNYAFALRRRNYG